MVCDYYLKTRDIYARAFFEKEEKRDQNGQNDCKEE